MARSYDPERLDNPDYVKWLKSWNVDVDNLPEMKAKNGTVKREVTPDDVDKSATGNEKTEAEKDQNISPSVPEQTSQTELGGIRADKNYEKWSIADLQAKLGTMELSKSGNKEDLIKRIKDAEA